MDEIYRKFTKESEPYNRLYESYIHMHYMAGVKRYYGEGLLFQNNDNAGTTLLEALVLASEFYQPLEIRATQHMLGEAALKGGRLKDAANHYQSAITLGQKQGSAQLPNFWSGLAKVRIQQGKRREASKLIEEALAYEHPIEVRNVSMI